MAEKWSRMDFWCRKCSVDFTDAAHQEVRGAYNGQQGNLFWVTSHRDCGTTCLRWITNRQYDPYFMESRMLREDRRRYERELIQPGDSRYNTIYGNPEDTSGRNKKREEIDRRRWEREHATSRVL